MFPIAGAVIGTVVAGPIGLFAGAKIGGILGIGIGGTAGEYLVLYMVQVIKVQLLRNYTVDSLLPMKF